MYVLNGRNPSPGLEGNEDAPPPLGASLHPTQLPFPNVMQQAQHNSWVWQLENATNAWEAAPATQSPQQGWGEWLVLPPLPQQYQGFNYCQFTRYDGPSMMDGILTDDTGHDDGLCLWDEYVQMVEEAAENFLQGRQDNEFSFN